ncbi:alpha/beta hydrolase, partial [Xanthomonas citri pv. citri]|nr:alpha/beta hydrolase [Xanthomonas citri pv. citri]
DISRDGLQTTWDLQPRSRDRQFQDAMLPYVARHDELYFLGDDPMQIRERWEDGGGTRTQLGMIVAGSFLLPAMYDTSQ